MEPKPTSIINLSQVVTGETVPIKISGKGPLSIQPIGSNIIGSPTYTLEVSSSKELGTFNNYHVLSTDVIIPTPIQITHDVIPWRYIRIVVTSNSSSGTVYFNITDNG